MHCLRKSISKYKRNRNTNYKIQNTYNISSRTFYSVDLKAFVLTILY